MPCYAPRQGFFTVRPSGTRKFVADKRAFLLWRKGEVAYSSDGLASSSVPCGKCIYCRVQRSRARAVQCVHEASLYSDNLFVTLTFDPSSLKKMCPTGSVDLKHMQAFMKKLKRKDDYERKRDGLPKRIVRQFYCGEYGEKRGRPHYHVLLFNFNVNDKQIFERNGDFVTYTSDWLRSVWSHGIVAVGELSFESAAYVARYCQKKINGSLAYETYAARGLKPEFGYGSNQPGLGHDWFEKYWSDVYPSDGVILRKGIVISPPQYYDRLLERKDPELMQIVKIQRLLQSESNEDRDEKSFARLAARTKCFDAKMSRLIRKLEVV